MELNWTEIIGYAGSLLIMVSLMMSSMTKLRWYNLVGAGFFCIYGLLVTAYPVALLNFVMVFTNAFHLWKIHRKETYFEIQEVRNTNKFLLGFLDFYHADITTHFPGFRYHPEQTNISLLIMRNMRVAGIITGRREAHHMIVDLDYALPEYRDLKEGKYLYGIGKGYFLKKGIKTLVVEQPKYGHQRYLKKMGFKSNPMNKNQMELHLS